MEKGQPSDHNRASAEPATPQACANLRVLASGSGGNLSVLRLGDSDAADHILIDAGIAPRTGVDLLRRLGVPMASVRAMCLTHLDADHFRTSWVGALPKDCRIVAHRAHARGIGGGRWTKRHIVTLDPAHDRSHTLELLPGVVLSSVLASHDDHGVTAFRFDLLGGTQSPAGPASIGFATDLGRVTDALLALMRGVDVMAIESNYCPAMQRASARSDFLKQRIMGGLGHLSNEQSREALDAIRPRIAVLLHLSRECNSPEQARTVHTSPRPAWSIVLSHQHQPTEWIDVRRSSAAAAAAGGTQLALFG